MKTSALRELIDKELTNTTGIVIKENGETILEEYFNQSNQENSFHLYSVTKSIVSLVIGIAIDKGYLDDVNQKIISFYPDFQQKENKEFVESVTIKDILTMSIPYEINDMAYPNYFTSENWPLFSLESIVGPAQKEAFIYAPLIGPDILSGIITKETGLNLLDFAKKYLFEPLEINVGNNILLNSPEDYETFNHANNMKGWIADSNYHNSVGWGLSLGAKDLIKIGELLVHQGTYQNQRIISKKWLDEMTTQHNQWKEMNLSYGYLWWLLDTKIYAAIGDGGNTLYIDEKRGLVIAITGYFNNQQEDRLDFIKEVLIPMLDNKEK